MTLELKRLLGNILENTVRFSQIASTSPLFFGLPEGFAKDFVNSCAFRTIATGGYAIQQGSAVANMFIVVNGVFEVVTSHADGQDVLLYVRRQGNIFGDVELLADQPAAASCRATTPSILLAASHSVISDATSEPTFLRNLFRLSYLRLKHDNTSKFMDRYSPVEQRLCYYLHQLSADRAEIKKTQSELSDLFGCARQTLNKELGRLREKGIVRKEKGKIKVVDRDALLQLAGEAARLD